MIKLVGLLLLVSININAQISTPLEKANFTKLTANNELVEFVKEVAGSTDMIKVDTLTLSKLGRVISLIKISNTKFGDSQEKVKVLAFAQQHGNEHSGKEAALLFLKNIVLGNLNYLFEKIDLLLIPQINPDGNDKNERRNGNGADLNRNHLILTEPETIALHKLFHQYLPESTLDIHEYTPYGKDWIEYGYRKNYDEQVGILTNPNIFNPLIKFQREQFLPFMKNFLSDAGFSFNEYMVGGPPNKSRLRYSTVDINDGRQSFGILNTFSVIFEGINGIESLDNIKQRTVGQYNAILGFLSFIYENSSLIKNIVNQGRNALINDSDTMVSIQMEHIGNSTKEIQLLSLKTNRDTTIEVSNFHNMVETKHQIIKPAGYLIPKSEEELISLLSRHNVNMTSYVNSESDKIFQYHIKESKQVELEDLNVTIPSIEKSEINGINRDSYLFVPINQIKSDLLVLMLEPESMINILQYKKFSFLLKDNSNYPILRVERTKK